MSGTKRNRRQETWKASDVLCPFYVKDCPSTIECEGIMENTTEILRFSSADLKNKHMGIYCAGRYEGCPKYKSVYQSKYAD